MISIKPALLALPMLFALIPATLVAQASAPAATAPVPAATAPEPATATSSPAATEAAPHITIATPAPAPAPWPLQERISWAAALALTVFAYIGIMMGISLLRKIERHLASNESAIESAAETSRAALEYMQSQAQADRPWILVSAEPTTAVPNSFNVVATNRGKSPARILSLSDGVAFIKDESNSPAPRFSKAASRARPSPQ